MAASQDKMHRFVMGFMLSRMRLALSPQSGVQGSHVASATYRAPTTRGPDAELSAEALATHAACSPNKGPC